MSIRSMSFVILSLVACAIAVRAGAQEQPFYSIEDKIPDAIESYYSPRISKILKEWPPREMPINLPESTPIWMRGIKTPGDDNYVGVEKRMLIHVPLAKAAELMSDFDRYKDRVPSLKSVRVIGRDGNRVSVHWETKSPVFFVPNTTYEVTWVVDSTQTDRVIYRFQLVSSNHLKFSDTLIVLEAQGDSTLLSTFDFFKLDLGLGGAFATKSKIWKNTMEGYFRGDIGFKLMAEHPEWKEKRIKKEEDRMLEHLPVEPIQFTDRIIAD